jgi:hypothetical protein
VDALGKVDGIKEVKLGRNKFFYEMKILENKPLLPAQLRKVAKALEDYPYAGLEVQGLAGKVEKSGEEYTFTARASNQKYALKPTDEVKKLVGAGKAILTLAGTVTQKADTDPLTLEVKEAKETAK